MDPRAALGPAAIDVTTLDGRVFTIPPHPASRWIEAVLDDSATAIMPGLLDVEDHEPFMAMLLTGRMEAEELASCAQLALQEASGWRWWEADRLIRTATQERVWPVLSGELAMGGMDLASCTLAEFCNAVWVQLIKRCQSENEVTRVELELRTAPAGVDIEQLWDENEVEREFMALHQGD